MNRRALMLLGATGLLSGITPSALADTLASDEAIVATQIKRLSNPNQQVQTEAAAVLRRIVAKYPSGTSNLREADAGKARWEKTLSQIKRGMTKADVLKMIPTATMEMSLGSGQSHMIVYRIDAHWKTTIWFENKDDTVITQQGLTRQEQGVGVAPPKDYTGTWTSWYINGQKCNEIQYANGKYNGTFTTFHDNGRKSVEQHYRSHTANGSDTGWYTSGKVTYHGQYKNGQQNGVWTHWYENGRKQSESTYTNGKNDGPDIRWYEGGQKQYEQNYRNGKPHGVTAAWNPQGTLEYKHEYKNGKMLDD